MGVLRIAMFGGRIPRLAPRLLPDTAAQQAMNARLTSGELRPWWQPKKIATVELAYPKSVYRYWHKGVAKFLAFRRATTVVESALINDAFDRIYYANSDGFFITTKDDIENGVPAVRAGVPSPIAPSFAVDPTGGDASRTETRVYLMTLVSKYGEESAPSPPKIVSAPSDASWRLAGLDSVFYDAGTYPNVVKLRIYRTITSGSGVDYRVAKEIDVNAIPAEMVDDTEDVQLVSAPVLESLSWSTPPEGLRGVIPMPNGFNAGFKGRTVYFSEPYFPHAWPEDYQLAVEDDIVALGHFGNTLVIATKGRVGVAVGTVPAAMSLVTDGKVAPCLSADSLVSTTGAVVYASEEGLISVSDAGVEVITKAFLTRDEWKRLRPEGIKAAIYESRYLGFYSSSMGFAFQFDDPSTAWTDVQHPGVVAVVTDETTSRTLLLAGQDVLEWEGDTDNPMTYSWRSKPMQIPKPLNFGAMQVRAAFDTVAAERPDAYPVVEETLDDPLGLNVHGVNEGEPIDGPAAANTDDPAYSGVLVRLFGNGRLQWEGMVRDEEPFRLPSGYKADEWEVEITGSIPVFSVNVGTTMKALEQAP